MPTPEWRQTFMSINIITTALVGAGAAGGWMVFSVVPPSSVLALQGIFHSPSSSHIPLSDQTSHTSALPCLCLTPYSLTSWGFISCFVLASWSISPNNGLTCPATILDLVATHFHILSTAPWNPSPPLNLHPRWKPFCMIFVVSAKNFRENRRAVLTSITAPT